jgi:putative ABC transport system permease protein
MYIKETLIISCRSIVANKLRTFLTMLGIIIGVGSVIAMISLGQGAQHAVTTSIQKLGSNLIYLTGASVRRRGVRQNFNRLDNNDVRMLQRHTRHLRYISPEIGGSAQVVYLNQNTTCYIRGTYDFWPTVRNFKVTSGRFFTDVENKARLRIAVIGAQIAEELFGIQDPLGKNIRINKIPFLVIGVLEKKGDSGDRNLDNFIIVPFYTAQSRVFGRGNYVDSMALQAVDESKVDAAVQEVTTILRQVHKLKPGQPDDFRVRSQADIIQRFSETTQTFTLLLAGIAAVSLVVGGIGIMNIMLVSVIERTREIGLRKAVGARERDIMIQFLLEAVLVS